MQCREISSLHRLIRFHRAIYSRRTPRAPRHPMSRRRTLARPDSRLAHHIANMIFTAMQCNAMLVHSRSSPLALPPPLLNDPQHLLPPFARIDVLPAHAHAHLLIRPDHQQPLQQQMLHDQTHVDSAVASIFLLRCVFQLDEA